MCDYLPWFPIFGGDGHACSDCNNDGFFFFFFLFGGGVGWGALIINCTVLRKLCVSDFLDMCVYGSVDRLSQACEVHVCVCVCVCKCML